MHAEDLIEVERQLGYRYEIEDSGVEHYQWICPRCRRALLALAQGQLWSEGPAEMIEIGAVMPALGNPGANQGPLGEEDRTNFHQ